MSQSVMGAWVVTAGRVAGVPIEEYRWSYRADEYEADIGRAEHDRSRYVELQDKALELVRELSVPSRSRWVTLQFVWF
jgi:hypothetical protein